MSLDPYLAKGMLDWCLGGAAAPTISGRWIQWATGSPTTNAASDGAFSSRRSVTFAPANSPQGSCTLSVAVTGATCSAAATVRGWNLYDASVGGNRLMYGTLTATLGCKSGSDAPAFGAGALKITLV